MMKKTLFFAVSCIFLAWSGFALPDFESVVFPWLHSEWLTKWDTVHEFRWSDFITRGEAAKFMSVYAEKQKLEKNFFQCAFEDIGTYDSTLIPYIFNACAYGLLKWTNGLFMPNQNITEAEALAVIIRSVFWFQDESWALWYEAYFTKAQEVWLLTDETLTSVNTQAISRDKLWTWLYTINIIQDILDEPPFYPFNEKEKENLATCLSNKNIIMYGTEWCIHCTNQKELFGNAFGKITSIDCDEDTQQCKDAGVEWFPTWINSDGKKYSGTQTLAKLDEISSCNSRTFPTFVVDYVWTRDDWTMFDTSLIDEAKKWWIFDDTRIYEPLTFILWKWELIEWFEEGVVWMKIGDSKKITLSPDKAYWEKVTELIVKISREDLNSVNNSNFDSLEVWKTYAFDDIQWTILSKNSRSITIDFNHPLAGETISFFLQVRDPNQIKKQKTTKPTTQAPQNTQVSDTSKLGMTWWAGAYNSTHDTTKIWCREGWKCDAYIWDRSCTELLPVVCIKENNSTPPEDLPTDFYNWRLSANIQFTNPVAWNTFKTLADVNAFCVESFGQWWRVGEFHDWKGWWWFYVQWDHSTASRFWININDQPSTCRSQQ